MYPGKEWESPYITNNSTFYQDNYINLKARTTFHFTADGITPAMAAQIPEGLGSRYQTTYKDKDGNFFDGNKTYKLNVPPKVPVKLFWSVTVYDTYTRAVVQTRLIQDLDVATNTGSCCKSRWFYRYLFLC